MYLWVPYIIDSKNLFQSFSELEELVNTLVNII